MCCTTARSGLPSGVPQVPLVVHDRQRRDSQGRSIRPKLPSLRGRNALRVWGEAVRAHRPMRLRLRRLCADVRLRDEGRAAAAASAAGRRLTRTKPAMRDSESALPESMETNRHYCRGHGPAGTTPRGRRANAPTHKGDIVSHTAPQAWCMPLSVGGSPALDSGWAGGLGSPNI